MRMVRKGDPMVLGGVMRHHKTDWNSIMVRIRVANIRP
jgi:hypothetical protein